MRNNMTVRKRNRRKEDAPPPATENSRGWARRHRWGLLAAVLCCGCACVVWALARERTPSAYGYQVVHAFHHDSRAYTQGLVFENGFLYEGTGRFGESTLRKVELETGRVLQSHSLDRRLFGEGITIWGDRIYQLTWRSNTAIVYDKATFRELRRFRYTGEGWGLTHNGTHLIMSDGTSTLRFLDPDTFRVVRTLLVRNRGRRVGQLNELEYVGGEILANVWGEDWIARISPESGQLAGQIDLRGLHRRGFNREAVLNGIAYDPEGNRLFVTGKLWPRLYEIRLTSR